MEWITSNSVSVGRIIDTLLLFLLPQNVYIILLFYIILLLVVLYIFTF